MSKHHHHKKCQSCNKHRPHYHEHCHHHHHKHHEHHEHHHHKRHCYHHKRHYRHHIVCPPTPTITYRCSGTPDFTCGPVLDGTGTYNTLAECQAACTAPVNRLLGTAANFRVLAGSTITNANNPTTIDGNLGLAPGTAVTGNPTITGASYVGPTNAVALQAKADLVIAYDAVVAATPVTTIPTELGGTTKSPGVYNSAAGTFGITGALVLDAGGDPNAVWMFQMSETLITAANSTVTIIGGQADNVYWQVGSSATLGIDSQIAGNILAMASITITHGAVVNGRALARNAAVTLDINTVGP
jgi:Ice-binding-like